MKDGRREQTKKKYPYETVKYTCPGCGAVASQTSTVPMNKLFLEQIEGTVCPDCRKWGESIVDWLYEWKYKHCLDVKFEIDKAGFKTCTTKSGIIVFAGRVGDCSGCPYNYDA